MTPSNPAAPRLLWRYLWAWTLLTLLTLWLTLAAVAYYTGLHEADEITDGQLVSSAELLLRAHARFAPASHAANPAYETRIFGPDRVKVQGRLVGLLRRY